MSRRTGAGGRPLHATYDEMWPERRAVGPVKRRISRKARRRARHSEVAAIASDLRRQTYLNQNRVHGAQGTADDGLTPAQRRRIRHKENGGRSHG